MSKEHYQIRTMHRDEVELAVSWAAKEGWNPGTNDAQSYYLADPKGFLVGLVNEEPVAVISAIRYDAEFGFIGFYIVKPEYRGKGYGYALWQAAMAYLDGCNVGLDGVVDQQDNYRKSGFELAYRNIRYEGLFKASQQEDLASPSSQILTEFEAEHIQTYEAPFFPANRDEFNLQWRTQSNAHALSLNTAEGIKGYGVIRACEHGYKIGPLYAYNLVSAKALIHALVAHIADNDVAQTVYLDVPERNQDAVSLAESLGMNVVFETARMYTKAQPNLPLERTFGVASFEIG
ncbi:GNAT family N-acetyltransferase [Pseudoalteromonas luteoviolacea]|uniref:GNAT family N-acetyltransferase n=1 Tax=Pseudoalteromonas luteoviolacea TaxID=43657 RepID=UPI0011527D6A|nr:GNAT family N-acetyltransferase [Pseudoalteromonas luteoviolacea]TQF68044.1 GNAT family N-acetyltransferase [Pseudoalteromonas luteoviolacea]